MRFLTGLSAVAGMANGPFHLPRRRAARRILVVLVLCLSTLLAYPLMSIAQTSVDYDADDDHLIEVSDLAQLNTIRWDLDGNGTADDSADDANYTAAFPNAANNMGCDDDICTGYELAGDLDFDTNGSGGADSGDDYWNDGSGWEPIGDGTYGFAATFYGNGHTISNLYIDRGNTNYVGLFGRTSSSGVVRNVGLTAVQVEGRDIVGGLVGENAGTVTVAYVTGSVTALGHGGTPGGLVGDNSGTITTGYAAASVTGQNPGGLVSQNNGGTITASYATGAVAYMLGPSQGPLLRQTRTGGLLGFNIGGVIDSAYAVGPISRSGDLDPDWKRIGGLIGGAATNPGTGSFGSVTNSYWDTTTTGQSTSSGGTGKTTTQLRTPESYRGIYADWNLNLDGLAGGDDPWDFGDSGQYPVLRVDFDGNGMATWQEFGDQRPEPGAPRDLVASPGNGEVTLTWKGASDRGTNITGYQYLRDGAGWTPIVGGNAATRSVTVSGLMNEFTYNFQLRAVSGVGNGTATEIVMVTLGQDYDDDNNGLIEVTSLAQLNAIRWDLDGDGAADDADNEGDYTTVFPDAADSLGCPMDTGCAGYELTAHLDFDTNGSGDADSGDDYWNSGSGWQPIGTSLNGFAATFHGDGHTISNLYINRNSTNNVGLFGYTTSSGVIRNVGLEGVEVTGQTTVGTLAGWNYGTVTASYATGSVAGSNRVAGLVGNNLGTLTSSYSAVNVTGSQQAGGLAGLNGGSITASYATGSVGGTAYNIGGLLHHNSTGATITASYATGELTSSRTSSTPSINGLVQTNQGTVSDSYWDTETTGQTTSAGGVGKTTSELRSPTGYQGIYANWNVDTDGVAGGDDPWDFGDSGKYPVLKVDFDGNGIATWQEFGNQRPVPGAPRNLTATSGHEQVTLTWTAADDHGSFITIYQYYQDDGSWTDIPGGVGATTVTISGLTDGTSYTFSVRAVSGNGNGVAASDSARAGIPPDAPGGLTAMAGVEDVTLTWSVSADNGAIIMGYQYQQNAGDWILIPNSDVSTTSYQVLGLTGGVTYIFRVRAVSNNGNGPASVSATAIPGHDYDSDDNGLIEVSTLAQLNAIRWDLDGDGAADDAANDDDYAAAFPDSPGNMVCSTETGCAGYELAADLDFDTNDSGDADSGDEYWNGGSGWEPISNITNRFSATFHGNGHIIFNLYIDRSSTDDVGLFGEISSSGVIRNIGLVSADVTARSYVGALVGSNLGRVSASYATGSVTGAGEENSAGVGIGGLVGSSTLGTVTGSYAAVNVNGRSAGGLVGSNRGFITASYATGTVSGSDASGGLAAFNYGVITASYATGSVSVSSQTGGLVGFNHGWITASYATGSVSGTPAAGTGGLVGVHILGTVTDSYWDAESSGQSTSAQGTGKTTSELRSPIGYEGIYADWNLNLDGLAGADDPWDFGDSREYPVLKEDLDGDGVATWQEFGDQRPGPGAPGNLTAMPGAERVTLTWTAAAARGSEITTYQYQQDDGEWTDIAGGAGATTVTITGLTNGVAYNYRVRAVSHAGNGAATAEVSAIPLADYDDDNNGLIEVTSLAQLNAIRWDLDGDGAADDADNEGDYTTVFPDAADSLGCPMDTGCAGYELTAHLDFDTNGSGDADSGDDYWNSGSGWQPIGTSLNGFAATFHGDGHTISNLYINRNSTNNVGLFGYTTSSGVIRNVGLEGVEVTGQTTVGTLAGWNYGTVTASYATGSVAGSNRVAGLVGNNLGTLTSSYSAVNVTGSQQAGGLAGLNGGSITASYATGSVGGTAYNIGGLLHHNSTGATITASYATGELTSSRTSSTPSINGLVQTNQGTVSDSYWDTETTGQTTSAGGVGKTTSELRSPTGYQGIYANWNVDTDGVAGGDDPWDFGDSGKYPALKVDFDGNGIATWQEFGYQRPVPGAPRNLTAMPGAERVTLTWTAAAARGSEITSYQYQRNDGSWTEVAGGAGATTVTVSGLTSGITYTFRVRAMSGIGNGPASAEVFAIPLVGYDDDGDGLVEVANLAQLNAIRWDLDGDGAADDAANDVDFAAVFPDAANHKGCQNDTCIGYELTIDLDLDTNGSGDADSGDDYWNSGAGWEPIGNPITNFTATFDGNGHTISNLHINRGSTDDVGMFGKTASSSVIRNIGLVSADVTANHRVGALVGTNDGTVTTGYATGGVGGNGDRVGGLVGDNGGDINASYSTVDVTSAGHDIGGLAGTNNIQGTVTASYATGSVNGDLTNVGGLVGQNNRGTITASYAGGSVTGDANYIGGLVGRNTSGTVTDSYWDIQVSGQPTSDGGEGKTTMDLRSPTSYQGIYVNWDVDTDGSAGSDDPWDFGDSGQNPVLKVDFDGVGMATWQEFGDQRRVPGAPRTLAVTPGDEQITLTWTAADDHGSDITIYQYNQDDTSWAEIPGGSAATTVTTAGLTNGTAYNFMVRATNGIGNGIEATVTAMPGVPSAPVGLAATPGDEEVTLRWTAAAGNGSPVTGYQYEQDGGTWADVSGGAAATTVTITSLTNGVTYTFKVRAVSAFGGGIEATVAVIAGLPGAPASLTATPGDEEVTLRWTAAAGNGSPVTGYQYQRDGGTWADVSGGAAATTVTITSLTNGVTYSYRVRALSAFGGGAAATVTAIPGVPSVPVGLTAMLGDEEVTLRWTAAAGNGSPVTGYQYQRDDGEWTDIPGGASATSVTITGLVDGISYTFSVRAVNTIGNGAATEKIEVTVGLEYDIDDNGLIEVANLAQLNAIRWDLDGDGAADDAANDGDYAAAFPVSAGGLGCPIDTGCTGYELTADLDFDTNGSGDADSGDDYWNGGSGWEPIGNRDNGLATTFHGNGHTISNLYTNRNSTDHVGLFGSTTGSGVIRNVGLEDVDVTGSTAVAALVGTNGGTVTASYATGSVSGSDNVGGLVGSNVRTLTSSYSAVNVTGSQNAGGLAGLNSRSITAAYATGSVGGTADSIGGLVYKNEDRATITASYATGELSSSSTSSTLSINGLVHTNEGAVADSYWDIQTTGQPSSAAGVGKDTSQLRSPTSYQGIYANWNVDLDGATGGDDPWDFGDSGQYPVLKVDFDGNGMATWEEFGNQRRVPGAPRTIAVTPGDEQITLTWSAAADNGSDISTYQYNQDDASWTEIPGGSAATTVTIAGLTNGTAYNFRVRAANAIGNGIEATVTAIPGVPSVPVGLTATPGDEEVTLRWTAAAGNGSPVTGYQYQRDDGEWTDIPGGASATSVTITGLVDGISYTFSVRAVNTIGNGAATEKIEVTVGLEYDIDDNGLIEVANLAQLNAIRWDLDGDGAADDAANDGDYAAAFPVSAGGLGCPIDTGCTGYELTADLDFDTNGSGDADSGDEYWDGGSGWQPIGNRTNGFATTFHGNGHTISNLYINRNSTDHVGLFGETASSSVIRNIGLVSADVTANHYVGALVGTNSGRVAMSYATGNVAANGDHVGGLVGDNVGDITASYSTVDVTSAGHDIGGLAGTNNIQGTVTASYASGDVNGDLTNVGGLVGQNSSGTITASYSRGSVTGDANPIGGLVGQNTSGIVTDSYWDVQASGQPTSGGGEGKTARDLRSPTGYEDIYANWDVDTDGIIGGDDPWDFGWLTQRPVLKVDFDGNGMATWEEFGVQRAAPGAPQNLTATPGDTQVTLTWTAADDNGSDIVNYSFQVDAVIWSSIAGGSDATTVTVTRLANGTPYMFRVRAINNAGIGATTPTVTSTPVPPPAQPENLIGIPGNGQVTIRWDDPNNNSISYYQIQQDGGEWTNVEGSDASTNEHTVTGLVNGTTYSFAIRAVNTAGFGATSANAMVVPGPPSKPANFTVTPGDEQITLAWDDPHDIGIAAYQFQQDAGEWSNVEGSDASTIEHTVTGLVNGTSYAFAVRAVNPGGNGEPSDTLTSTPGEDYDEDNDGLIEVFNLAQFNAIRWDRDGDGSSSDSGHAAAYPNAGRAMGCPGSRCWGYELVADLDFDTNGNGTADSGDDYWNGGRGWDPIGGHDNSDLNNSERFNTTLEGNGHTISNLFIDRSTEKWVGLISFGDWGSTIRNVGLVDADVTGGRWVGIIAGGFYSGRIISSFSTGSVTSTEDFVGGLIGAAFAGTVTTSYSSASVSGDDDIGGLVGWNDGASRGGSINASYATGDVSGDNAIGGLVGYHNHGVIIASYATGTVSGNEHLGGLVGDKNLGTTRDSYWDTETTGQSNSSGGEGKTTSELQSPTGYGGIYANWDLNLDGVDGGESPWDFGTSGQYPVLLTDFNGDTQVTWQEFGDQRP